jgi:hypothetical protein
MYRIIIAILIITSLSLFGNGCGSSSNNTTTTTDTTTPSGSEVLYAKDIQTIFNANCTTSSCHGNSAPSGLKLITYADFTKGGVSGKPYVAGDSANSLIIKRLEGKIAPRMPQGGAALPASQIQRIKDWIDAGGKNN